MSDRVRALSTGRRGWRARLGAIAALLLLFGSLARLALAAPPEPETEWLMVQEAKSGTFVPDGQGGYILTPRGVNPAIRWLTPARPTSLRAAGATAWTAACSRVVRTGSGPWVT